MNMCQSSKMEWIKYKPALQTCLPAVSHTVTKSKQRLQFSLFKNCCKNVWKCNATAITINSGHPLDGSVVFGQFKEK